MNYLIKKISFLIVFIFVIQSIGISQNTDSTKVKTKVIKKGFAPPFIYLGLSVGASAYVDLNIVSGVQINERFNLGVIGKYQYYTLGGSLAKGFNTHVYGYGVFLQSAIIKDFRKFMKLKVHSGLFIHTEYEMLNLNSSYFEVSEDNDDRFWLNDVIIGPGYYSRFNNSSIFAMLLWNINHDEKNPYEYPLFKVGFTYGF